MQNKSTIIFSLPISLLVILSCNISGPERVTRGRIKYVITREHRSGSHGWGSEEVVKREFFVDGEKWSPPGYESLSMVPECLPSPNEAVEAFLCDEVTMKEWSTFVLRMNNDTPEYVKVRESPAAYYGSMFVGAWLGDGKWLIFRDHFYNIETKEERAIKLLPAEPRENFAATSPDMKTIVYLGAIWIKKDDPTTPDVYREPFERKGEYIDHKLQIVWLIDAETGAATHREISWEKYPWVFPSAIKKFEREEQLKEFRKNLVWAKDEIGRDRLVFPN